MQLLDGVEIMYKLAIVGSRRFINYDLMCRILEPHLGNIALIISGGAIGADTLAQKFAKDNAIPIHIYYPDWKKYGKRAGFRRNVIVANLAERMIAFAYNDSRGTRHVVSKMKELNKPVTVIELGEDNVREVV